MPNSVDTPEASLPRTAALYDAAALRGIETAAAQALGDAYELMRRAGQAAWRELLAHWPQAQRLIVVCGPGNNGGDGYVLALHAQRSGRDVAVVRLPAHAPRSGLAQRAAAAYVDAGGRVVAFADRLPAADLVVDAIFGIGLSRAPDTAAAALIDAINSQPAPIFALDAPSGVDADRGVAHSPSVRAARTLEFIAHKGGLRTGAALDHVGALSLATLELPEHAYGAQAAAEWLQVGDLARWLKPRRLDSHKGRNGRVLCVGGEHGSGGAILMAAEAALRSGAGLLDVATRAAHVPALLARLPEAMARGIDASDELAALLERADTVIAGPGLGQGEWGRALFAAVVATNPRGVLDADALNLLAEWPRLLGPDCVLTPHPGEAARLLGTDTASVQADRFAAVRDLCERYGCAVALKGAGTLVAAPGRRVRVIGAGNPGMAVGGMGDVLTGVIAALQAQGLDAFEAASAGALLHSAAGDAAARDGGQRGLLPSDLMPWLRRLANPENGP